MIKCSNRAQQQTLLTPEPCHQPCITEKDWEGCCTAGLHVCKALGSILSTQHRGVLDCLNSHLHWKTVLKTYNQPPHPTPNHYQTVFSLAERKV